MLGQTDMSIYSLGGPWLVDGRTRPRSSQLPLTLLQSEDWLALIWL